MHAPLAVNDTEVYTLWWVSVAVAIVVVIVAAGLLANVLIALRNIDSNVAAIWSVAKGIANNTVQLWLLDRVAAVVKEIREHAYRVNDVASAIAQHAQKCQHCPSCAAVASGIRGQPAPPAATTREGEFRLPETPVPPWHWG
jgi:uncharacterized protein YoxC